MEGEEYNGRVFGMFGGRAKYEESIERLVDFAGIWWTNHVLELCCGTGIATKHILRCTPHLVAVELNEKMVKKARECLSPSVEVLAVDALKLGKEHEQRYEGVLCINGFHYFEPEEFYCLARKVIRPGGHLVFNVKLRDYRGIRPLHYQAYDLMGLVVNEVYSLMKEKMRVARLKDQAFIDSDYTKEHFSDFLGEKNLFKIVQKQINLVFYDTEEAKRAYFRYWEEVLRKFFWHGHDYYLDGGTSKEILQRHLSPLLDGQPKEKLLGKAELFIKAEPRGY